MLQQPKNILVRDVTLNWARLDTPAENPFGGPPNWEVQISTENREQLAELEAVGAKVKENEGTFSISLRRKSIRNDGSANDPVRVVDNNKQPMDGPARRRVGNGSTGNVIVWAAPYEYMKRTGVTFSLTAVQVVNVVEYVSDNNIDFDAIDVVATETDELKDIAF